MPYKRVKLKDIAKILNLSVSTVSKSLSGHSDINTMTRQRVIETAKKLNYVPDLYARGLRTQKTFTIGVIIPDVLLYFNATVLKGIINTTKQYGYRVLISESQHHHKDEKETLQHMINANVEGILLSINRESDNIDHILEAAQYLPIVLFDKVSDKAPLTKIVVDEEKGAYDAVEHLILQGRKRIVHISGTKNSYSAKKRFQGYCNALKKYQLPYHEQLVIPCENVTIDEGYKIICQLLHKNIVFDAVFGVTDNVAIGAIKALMKQGIRIPEAIAVVGFSDSEKATIIAPNLSSVHQPGFGMGREAVHYLIKEIAATTEIHTPKTVELSTYLCIRDSSALK